MAKFNKILNIDQESHLATVQAGIFGPELEAKLNPKGFMVGHFPQSFEFSTLGGWIAARSSGQNSLAYGGIEKLVADLKIISPSGTITTHSAPRCAEGPDLKQMIMGSEGILGIIVSATLRIRPLPQEKDYFLLAFPSFKHSVRAARKLIQNNIFPAMIRVSDEDESEVMLALRRQSPHGKSNLLKKFEGVYLKFMGVKFESLSLVLIGLEGEDNQYLRHKIHRVLSQDQYFNLGRKPGESWLKDRFYVPYLRDELLDNEIFVETLETATTWENLHNLYQGVRQAILKVCQADQLPGVVYAHLSHLYPEGASLYFSIMAAQRKEDPLGQWVDIKRAANQAITQCKGVISHHHGIGLDHKDYLYSKESQETHLLKNMKETLDPQGILNPGKLLS